MKTVKGFGRLLMELPQPARSGLWIGYAAVLAGFLFSVVTGRSGAVFVGMGVSGAAFAVTGWWLLE
ncbi:hypothetical protein ABIB35_003593 [Arthrobacter sp. UYP6]|uniref:hypothetical protein n=1 Tax=Arthrobacter sp. UYP6 TaxID=1756378 RepID=UPI0033927868